MVDYGLVTSIASTIAIVVTLITFSVQIRRQQFSLQMDLLMKLEEMMESEKMRILRKAASKKLLSGKATYSDVNSLLNYFATIAFLYNRKAINQDILYNEFSWWIVRYWLCCQHLVLEWRKTDPMTFTGLEQVANKLIKREKKDKMPTVTEEVRIKFLQVESSLLIQSGPSRNRL